MHQQLKHIGVIVHFQEKHWFHYGFTDKTDNWLCVRSQSAWLTTPDALKINIQYQLKIQHINIIQFKVYTTQ